MQLDVPREPVLILKGCMHVAKPKGTQAGGQGSLHLVSSPGAWQSGRVTAWHKYAHTHLPDQATIRIYRHSFHLTTLVHGQSLHPLLQRGISLPKAQRCRNAAWGSGCGCWTPWHPQPQNCLRARAQAPSQRVARLLDCWSLAGRAWF